MSAERQDVTNPNNTVCVIPHFFDLGYDDPEIQDILFKTAHEPNNDALVENRGKFCSYWNIYVDEAETAEKYVAHTAKLI